MNPRVTGILLLLAAALGAFVWFYEIEGEADRKAAEDAEKRLFSGLEPEDVQWVELTSTDGVRVRGERGDAGWDVVVPLLFPGDPSAWDGMAAALASTTSEAVFDEPQPPEVYGLGEGADELRFGVGDVEHALRLGASAPLGGNTYAAVVGQPAVHTIATWRATSLRKAFDALRNKRVLDFDAGSVKSFVAEWPDGRVSLEKQDEVWRMLAPVEGPADAEVIGDLLSDLSFLRAEGFEDAPPSDAEAGLEPPTFRIVLTLTDPAASDPEAEKEQGGAAAEPRVIELAVGGVTSDSTRLARGAQASLYRIAEARLDGMPRDVSAYRYKQLAEFAANDAKRVELTFRGEGGAPVSIVATRGESGWSSEPEAMDAQKMQGLVDALAGLTADTILAERVGPEELAGLELAPPMAAFRVLAAEGAEPLAEVRLGALQGSDGVVAQAGENPQVLRLAIALSEDLPVSLEAFRNRFLTKPEAAAGLANDEMLEDEGGLQLDFDADTLDELLSGEDAAP